MVFALAWLVAILPHPSISAEVYECDAIIRNRVWRNWEGAPQVSLDQVGGLRLMTWLDGEYHWEWWRYAKDTGEPVRCNGVYVLTWHDERTHRTQTVHAACYWVVDSDYDLEIADHRFLRPDKRRGLL